jgi:hypothetical protein
VSYERRLEIRRFAGLGFGVGASGWPLGRFAPVVVPVACVGGVGLGLPDGLERGDVTVNFAFLAVRRRSGIGEQSLLVAGVAVM